MKPTLLIILDGWGERHETEHNSIRLAKTPRYNAFLNDYPNSNLLTHGRAVGLIDGVMGNSEVGHTNIGAGRIVLQTLSRIAQVIEDQSFFSNPTLLKAMQTSKEKGSSLHLMGLMSDAGVHSDMAHLEALLKLAQEQGLKEVKIHAFMDGRDTSPRSGAGYLTRLQTAIDKIGIGQIASISGRYYAMDRDKRWDRTEKAYRAIAYGDGELSKEDPATIMEDWYAVDDPHPGFGDEFIHPKVIGDFAGIQEDDVVIHFNFRPDRARQLTEAITNPQFKEFDRGPLPKLANYTCLAPYSEGFDLPVAFSKEKLSRILGELIAEKGMKQFRCAETEKYAHVTYFFNGGEEKVFPGEDRKLIPSNREIATYDLAPEMRAREVTTEVLDRLNSDAFDFYVINFANPDMVGHTGKEPAAIKAVETLDECLGKIVDAALAKDGTVLITADHGNCEEMLDADGHPHTQHTLNPVPFLVIDKQLKDIKLKDGRLCDVAPTILELMEIEKPKEMTGESLITKE